LTGPPGISGIGSVLYDVAVISSRDVWAVGSVTAYGHPFEGLTMHWSGKGWTVTLIPVADAGGQLVSVAAISPSDIWAVGTQGEGSQLRPLSEHWLGTSWRTVSTDPAYGEQGFDAGFSGVAASASSDVWAVGSIDENPVGLVEHWDGRQWKEWPTRDLTGWLSNVAVVARDDAWAVGVQDYGTSGSEARVERLSCA
jgi:hypothetical protein